MGMGRRGRNEGYGRGPAVWWGGVRVRVALGGRAPEALHFVPGGWVGRREGEAQQAAVTARGQGKRSAKRDGKRQGQRRTSEVVIPRAGVGAAQLTDEDREWVRRTVAGLGPLADEDRNYLALIFKNHR